VRSLHNKELQVGLKIVRNDFKFEAESRDNARRHTVFECRSQSTHNPKYISNGKQQQEANSHSQGQQSPTAAAATAVNNNSARTNNDELRTPQQQQ